MRMQLIKILFLPICLSFFLQAADTRNYFQHNAWTIDEGLPMNTVNAVIQTPDGYLWVGTESGLCRFDGIWFETFNQENTPTFCGSVITSFLVDKTGSLWVATRGDGVIRYQNNAFEPLTEKNGLLSNETWTMIESLDGSIWIGSMNGINRIIKGRITVFPLPRKLAHLAVKSLLEDRKGRIWVGTTAGLALINRKGDELEWEHIGLDGMEICTLCEDRQGNIWVGTVENGLICYGGDEPLTFTTQNGLKDNYIRCLLEDRRGNLWIGSYSAGIGIIPAGTQKILPLQNQEDFSSKNIMSFCEDREGTIWIGTNGGGLNSLRETVITTYTEKSGLSHHNVYGVLQDKRGRVWVGTRENGVNYFEDKHFHTLTTGDGLPSNAVVAMAEGLDGALWFGTMGGGIARYLDGSIDVYNTRHGLSYNFIRSVYADPQGNIWAGTLNGGIHRFENGRFSNVAQVKFRINVLFKDSQQNLWAGTFGNGLHRLKGGDIEIFNTQRGLSNNIVCCIHEDSDHVLWVGTLKGLNRFKDGTFSHLYKKDGLPDDTVYWLIEDPNRDFWISSNRGIYYLRRNDVDNFFAQKVKTVRPVVFGKEAGMRSVECNGGNQPAGCRTRDGRLWFPTTHGLSVIDPLNMGINQTPPPVIIEKVVVNGRNYPVDRELVIPPGKNNIEIRYTALSFIAPEKIQFKYRMEEYDDHWIDAATARTVHYAALSPGHYRFRVIACNSDGVWNETGAMLAIALKPKYYETLLFKIAIFILLPVFILAVYFFIYRRLDQAQFQGKARTLNMNPDETEKCIHKLLYLFNEEKIFKDADITLKSLSSRLLVSPRLLSQIINDRLKVNFHDLINQYRIKEAQRILTDPRSGDKSILDIAYEVGFNSKSAFNRIFKKHANLTPSWYRRRCQESKSAKA